MPGGSTPINTRGLNQAFSFEGDALLAEIKQENVEKYIEELLRAIREQNSRFQIIPVRQGDKLPSSPDKHQAVEVKTSKGFQFSPPILTNKTIVIITVPRTNTDGTLSTTDFDILRFNAKTGEFIDLVSNDMHYDANKNPPEISQKANTQTTTQIDLDWLKGLYAHKAHLAQSQNQAAQSVARTPPQVRGQGQGHGSNQGTDPTNHPLPTSSSNRRDLGIQTTEAAEAGTQTLNTNDSATQTINITEIGTQTDPIRRDTKNSNSVSAGTEQDNQKHDKDEKNQTKRRKLESKLTGKKNVHGQTTRATKNKELPKQKIAKDTLKAEQKRNAGAKKELDDLKEKLAKLKQDKINLTIKQKSAKKKFAKKAAKSQTPSQDLDKNTKYISSLEKKIKELEKLLILTDSLYKSLLSQTTSDTKSLNQKDLELDNLRKKIQEQNSILDQLKSELKLEKNKPKNPALEENIELRLIFLSEANTALQKKLARSESENTKDKEELARLKLQLEEAKEANERANLQAQHKLEIENIALKIKFAAVEQENKDLGEALKETKHLIQALSTENKDLRDQNNTLLEAIEKLQGTRKNFEKEKKSLEKDLQKVKKELAEIEQTKDPGKLQQRLKFLINDKRNYITITEDRITKIADHVNHLNTEIRSLRADLARTQKGKIVLENTLRANKIPIPDLSPPSLVNSPQTNTPNPGRKRATNNPSGTVAFSRTKNSKKIDGNSPKVARVLFGTTPSSSRSSSSAPSTQVVYRSPSTGSRRSPSR